MCVPSSSLWFGAVEGRPWTYLAQYELSDVTGQAAWTVVHGALNHKAFPQACCAPSCVFMSNNLIARLSVHLIPPSEMHCALTVFSVSCVSWTREAVAWRGESAHKMRLVSHRKRPSESYNCFHSLREWGTKRKCEVSDSIMRMLVVSLERWLRG